MCLRQHEDAKSFRAFQILEAASRHTSDEELKKRIIAEVINHPSNYYTIGNMDDVAINAFDIIREQDKTVAEKNFQRQVLEQQSQTDLKIKKATAQAESNAARKAAEMEAERKTKPFLILQRMFTPICVIIAFFYCISVVLWAFNVSLFSLIFLRFIPPMFRDSISMKWTWVTAIAAVAVFFYRGLQKFLKYMAGNARKELIRRKYRESYQKYEKSHREEY